MSTQTASLRFFGKIHDETVRLAMATRDYLTHANPGAAPGLSPMDGLRLNCECLRLTSRLAHAMAWILAQKAQQAGEISLGSLGGTQYQLAGQAVCLNEGETDAALLPKRLLELLEASRLLYVRVARLDELVRRAGSAA